MQHYLMRFSTHERTSRNTWGINVATSSAKAQCAVVNGLFSISKARVVLNLHRHRARQAVIKHTCPPPPPATDKPREDWPGQLTTINDVTASLKWPEQATQRVSHGRPVAAPPRSPEVSHIRRHGLFTRRPTPVVVSAGWCRHEELSGADGPPLGASDARCSLFIASSPPSTTHYGSQ